MSTLSFKIIKYCDTAGSGLGMVGAVLIALNINQFVAGYIFFIGSTLFWIVYAVFIKNKSLGFMNIVFLIINIIGLVNFARL